jgi:hypothetical protein
VVAAATVIQQPYRLEHSLASLLGIGQVVHVLQAPHQRVHHDHPQHTLRGREPTASQTAGGEPTVRTPAT